MAILRDEITQDLSVGEVDTSIDYAYDIEVVQILFHASTNITETVTIIFDSGTSSGFDTSLGEKNMSAEDDYVYRPIIQPVIPQEDKLRIQVTNANTTGTIRITVLTEARQ